jgi:hypothetical protein
VAERKIKSLYRTGRISRAEARAVAERLRGEMITNGAKRKVGKILASTTASGRGAIAFHVVFPAAAKRAAANRSHSSLQR